ncbi:protein DEHYDRATION-INDUCED 19 homolog 3-like [Corylus avellana]|uniref:protein DEHYDRATION-INDUCED 19 homolog 3-like n=1 Tax=Corylus avellana TaxID=13451 RepID=UPI00286AE17D|nr:protein DEHYDRATION-INDUCED 19 homolog 3-like [Corylus avellana]
MEDDAWSFDVSIASRNYHQSTTESQSDLCIDLDEFEGDDELKTEHPCPFCPEDFDLVGLFCHIDEEHPIEANAGVCPICATRVGMNMVGHITTQHGNISKSWHKLKLCKGESYSTLSFSRKEFQDGHFRSFPTGSSSVVSTSKMAPDPLLSFIYNAPAVDESESIQPDSSTEVSIEDENSDEPISERNSQLNALSDKDQMEKARRCDFVQELLFFTILDDGS